MMILMMSYFIIMKGLLLILILIILVLMIILMKKILILLFVSDFSLDILNFKNANNLKKELNKELMSVAWRSKGWWDWCM